MKICLVHPAFDIYFTHEGPIGLAYLQAVLRKAKHETEVIDNNILNLPNAEVAERCGNSGIVAISMTTPTFGNVKELCEKIMELGDNRPKIVLGGAHPTIAPKECLDFADFVVVGEGEETIIELVDALGNGAKESALKRIRGLGFSLGGKKTVNEKREFNRELGRLPFPDWAGFPIEKYGSALRVSGRSLPVTTSRGCPYGCVYCFKVLFGRIFRARPPKNVADEIEYLRDEFGIREFQIADDAFAADRERAKEICRELIRRKIKIPWSMPNGIRAGSLDAELVILMKKAGLEYVGIGVESGSQKLLDRIGKQQTLDEVRGAVRLLKSNKIETVGFFMFGLPGETKETMEQTVKFAKELDLDYCSISMTTPYPGTRLYDEIKAGGGRLLTKTPEELFSLGSSCKFIMPGMAKKGEIEERYRKARTELLLRPRSILQALKKPKRLISGAKVAYKWLLKT